MLRLTQYKSLAAVSAGVFTASALAFAYPSSEASADSATVAINKKVSNDDNLVRGEEAGELQLSLASAQLPLPLLLQLSLQDFTPLTVSKNETVGKNVYKVTLDFPNKSDVLGMTTAGMLMVQGPKRDGSGVIARPYTPVSRNDTVGKLELVVKDYPGVGNVSSHICGVKPGDTLSVKGCFTKIKVTPNKWKKVRSDEELCSSRILHSNATNKTSSARCFASLLALHSLPRSACSPEALV